ncbi:hypothetical protein [Leptothoe kymatousa]|uniref:Mannosyltransferase n=1 Tax=Leptothoe kymatousa TAU-MAC 1615 TaxID=2364775 RepID=A0ABS5Y4W9_9CYAN|nr:hypothetical protein [Leptothoe kymatousa]MBT9312404.1 hypothetical protein [Leptothoe kymatousa TAU-MAC 1615]
MKKVRLPKLTGRQVTGALLLALLALGCLIYHHHGVSTDETLEINMVMWHLDAIGSANPTEEISSDLEYYGLFFNLVSMGVFLLTQVIQTGVQPVEQLISQGLANGDIYVSKHLVTYVFSGLAYVGVALFTKDLLRWSFAPVAVVVLALAPRFWGHSFFNPKDIPFAALFTVVSYVGARFTAELADPQRDNARGGSVVFLRKSLVFGALAGLLTCIRAGGFVVLGYGVFCQVILLAVGYGARTQETSSTPSPIGLGRRCLLSYGVAIAAWATVTTLLSPVAWGNPMGWFVETIAYLSSHTWEGVTLTFGQKLPPQPPWFYLPVWFGITTPLITLLLASVGLGTQLRSWLRLTPLQQSLTIWLILQLWALPVVGIVKRSTIYNAERQFLFVLPAVAVFAVLGLAWFLNHISHRFWRTSFITLLVMAYGSVTIDLVRLHPYEYVYFNSIARSERLATDFETDYWGVSVREAIEWVNGQVDEKTLVLFHAPSGSIRPFADETLVLDRGHKLKDVPYEEIQKPFYYVAYPRNKYGGLPHPQDRFPQCDRVFTVQRPLGSVNIPLTIVKKCQ